MKTEGRRNRLAGWMLALIVLVGFPRTGDAGLKSGSHASHAKTKTSAPEPAHQHKPTHTKHPIPYPGEIVKDKVAVAAELLDREQTMSLFEVDLARHGVQPVSIRIRNGSDQVYRFRKADIDHPLIPAVNAARYASSNMLLTGVRFIRWGVLVIPVRITEFLLGLLPVVDFSAEEANPFPVMNAQIRKDFQHVELPDADIAANESLDGFVFMRQASRGSLLKVKLVNNQTQQPLEFELHL